MGRWASLDQEGPKDHLLGSHDGELPRHPYLPPEASDDLARCRHRHPRRASAKSRAIHRVAGSKIESKTAGRSHCPKASRLPKQWKTTRSCPLHKASWGVSPFAGSCEDNRPSSRYRIEVSHPLETSFLLLHRVSLPWGVGHWLYLQKTIFWDRFCPRGLSRVTL